MAKRKAFQIRVDPDILAALQRWRGREIDPQTHLKLLRGSASRILTWSWRGLMVASALPLTSRSYLQFLQGLFLA